MPVLSPDLPVAADRRTIPGAWVRDGGADAARRWLEETISAGGRPIVLLVALSRLDLVNAAHGRAAGDALMRVAAARMATAAAAALATEPLVARLDGSRFALLAPTGGRVAIAQAAGAIATALLAPVLVDGVAVAVGHRIGAAAHEEGDDAAALLRRADEALATARASDGATVHVAGAARVAPLDALAADLHHALAGGQLEVVFQPQVAIADGRVTGVEALARWAHPALGELGAEALFAAAAHADLALVLSLRVQALALEAAGRWPARLSAYRLSLNLTAADLARPGFADTLIAAAAEGGFPLERVTLEVTETGRIDDLAAAAALLDGLRAHGCRVALDDFGAGYASLAYVKALPLDYLKLDRGLVHGIDRTSRDRAIVAGAIDLAHALGLAVIAEGVETEAQLAALAGMGCDQYQGFLHAAPLDTAALLATAVEASSGRLREG